MATQEDRSLGAGITIPKWMKGRMTDKFDFDQSAFSPTELDDSFMLYYRHPKNENSDTNMQSKIITTNLPDNIQVTKVRSQDFSKHPPPCQKYLQNTIDISPPPQTTPEMKIKSSGTDDGFKGEAAKCGSSIIRVASQMVSGKVVNGFHITESKDDCDNSKPPETYNLMKRRGSKSLPASPLTSPGNSPKSNRKSINKYFTGAFTDVDKSKGSWILSNLYAKREVSQSVGYIGEESKEDLERASSTASIEDISRKNVYKAKPSELREMNFWSPTSM